MFKNKTILINPKIRDRIVEFYISAKIYKYSNKYDWSEVFTDINLAYNDNTFTPSNSTKRQWINNGYKVVKNKRKWVWAYREKDNVVIFEDVENYRNLPITLSKEQTTSFNNLTYANSKRQPYTKIRHYNS